MSASNKSTETSTPPYFYSILLTLIIACILSYVSHLGICSEACAKSHNFRLYGFTFEFVGMIFFPLVTLNHLLSSKYTLFSYFTALMLASAVGAELFFMYVQKFMIGHWCPLCLSIAAMVAIAAGLKYLSIKKLRGLQMNTFLRASVTTAAIIGGFIFSFAGLGINNQLQAKEESVKEKIAFGNLSSPIDVYIFTDWICPACESLEPTFENILPHLTQNAKVIFVDDPIHDATTNYTPYNLSFMVNNKAQYLKLRHGMHQLAGDIKDPTDEDIDKMASKYGVRLKELNFGTLTAGSKLFTDLIKKYDIQGTPTIVIYNKQTKKSKKLEGLQEIDQEKIIKAVESLKANP